MLKIEQIVEGKIIATCKILNTAEIVAEGYTYKIIYKTTEYHHKHPSREIQFEINHSRSDSMESLIKKVYDKIDQDLR